MASGINRFGKAIRQVSLQLLVVFVLLEISLRMLPSVISPAWLIHFNSNIRSEVIEKLGLNSKSAGFQLERSDGGRSIDLLPPNQKIHVRADGIDVAQGAIEEVVTDGFGFCNTAGIDVKSIDVLAVGDSFTWCTTLPATAAWPALLTELSDKVVYNAGLSGVGFHEYLELARFILPHMAPKTLVVAIYAGNDLLNAHGTTEYKVAMQRGDVDPEIAAMPTFEDRGALGKLYYLLIEKSLLGKYSYVVNVSGSLVLAAKHWLIGRKIYQRSELVNINFRYTVTLGDGQKVSFNPYNLDRNELLGAYQLARGELSASLWDDPVKRLEKLQRDENLEVVIVLIPSAHTAYHNSSNFEDSNAKPALLDFHEHQSQYLALKSANNGWKYQDLAGSFIESVERTNKLLYFPGNLHLTESGHNVVAREVLKLLLSR